MIIGKCSEEKYINSNWVRRKMKLKAAAGYAFAILNPVILGVALGYFVYRDEDEETREHGFNIIILSLTMAILYLTLFMAFKGTLW